MWPILIGIGAALMAQGIREGVKEHREQSNPQLPSPPPRRQLPSRSRQMALPDRRNAYQNRRLLEIEQQLDELEVEE